MIRIGTARQPPVTAGALALMLAFWGCRSAAEVILDLPEPDARAAALESGGGAPPPARSRAVEGPGVGTSGDTVLVRPAIESVRPESVLVLLSRHSSGQLDWTAAIDSGIIAPRAAVPGGNTAESVPGFAYDYYFGDVETFFPHSTHGRWLTCTSCHPAVFRTRGAPKTTMAMIQEGESCGTCHGKAAFGVDACERCHPSLGLPAGRIQPELAADLVLPRDSTAGMGVEDFPASIFPHWTHRLRYTCSACHPARFGMELGSTEITMDGMQRGETCGTCHDGDTAFGVMECGSCHRSPPPPITPAAADGES